MPDEFDAYVAKINSKGSDKGFVGKFKDLYDRFDQSWLPAEDFSKEQYVEENWGPLGKGLGALNRGIRGVARGVTDSLIGSPVRAAGTLSTVATGGLSKVPTVARMGIAGLDAANAVRSGINANDEYQQGNYGMAVGSAIGAGLSGAGAAVPFLSRPVARVGRGYVPEPEVVIPKPVAKPDTLNVSSTLPEVVPPVSTQATLLGNAPPPARYSRTVVRNQPKGLIEEGAIPLANQSRGASGVALTEGQDLLAERAAREFDALQFPANSKNINRYINDKEFRTKIQADAEKIGATQRYESTVGTKYVQEAPVPVAKPKEVTVQDVKDELAKRGMVNPSNKFIARIRKDTELQDRMGMREVFMEGTPMPPTQVKGYLTIGTTQIPEPIPTQAKLFSPDDLDDIKLEKVASHKDVSPEVRTIASQARDSLKKSSWFRQTYDSLGTSMEAELERMGPVGAEIARQVKIASTDKPIRFNSYIKDVRADIEALDKGTFEKVVDYLEGTNTKPTDVVKSVGDKMKRVLDQTGTDLQELGLLEKGKRTSYWPRRYENVPESTLRESMRAQGMTDDQIKANLQRIKDFREQKISGEYTRNDLNVPGYRKDKDVFVDHLREVSNRIEDAARFGPKDITDASSPISKLIAQSENPERARDLMNRILRGDATSTDWQRGAAKAVRHYATMSQLSHAAISNFGGTLPILVRSSANDAISGVGRAFAKELPEMKFMENTNLFRQFSGGFAEALNDNNRMYRAFGIEQSQNWLNRYAGAVGNSYVQTLFDGLKQNPNNQKLMSQLEDLVLDKGSEVLKQDSLTSKQIERAMVRMAEVTQGVMENRKLPYFWNKEGIATIPQIFMRTSFQTSKALKDAIKMDPMTAIPKLLGGGLLIGEVIGDTKEAAKTAAQVGMNTLQQSTGDTKEDKNFVDEYKKNIGVSKDTDTTDRFSFTRQYLKEISPELAKNETVVRALGNLEQSFALGMPADVLRSISDAMNESRGDPLSEAMKFFWAVDEGNQLARTAVKATQGNYRDVGREVLKRVPYVGRGAAREINTANQEKRAAKKGDVVW